MHFAYIIEDQGEVKYRLSEQKNFLDIAPDLEIVAREYFIKNPDDEFVKICAIDFPKNTAHIFEFQIEKRISCTIY
jgi:hypothetical protein